MARCAIGEHTWARVLLRTRFVKGTCHQMYMSPTGHVPQQGLATGDAHQGDVHRKCESDPSSSSQKYPSRTALLP